MNDNSIDVVAIALAGAVADAPIVDVPLLALSHSDQLPVRLQE